MQALRVVQPPGPFKEEVVVDKPYYVHSSAFVDEPCTIGAGTKIWHFSHVMPKCTIGERCILGQNVHVATGVVIGSNVKIQNNVSLYDGAIIEDDVFLGPSCVFTNVSNPRSQIVRRHMYEKTIVKRGASIGANSTIVCGGAEGTTIGRYALIAAGAVVTKDVPDYALVMGVPGRVVGWVSRHGHRLPKPGADGIMVCPETGWKYQFENNVVRCLDLDEEAPIPA